MSTGSLIRFTIVLLIGIAAFAAVAAWAVVAHAQGASSGLVVGHQEATVSNTVTVPTALQSLPDGLAGFQAALRSTDPSVASIEAILIDASLAVEGPELAVEGLDAGWIRLTVVDLADFWQVGAGFSNLFNTRLTAKAPGHTTFEVQMLKLTSEDGSPLATTTAGVLVVVQ